MSVSDHAGTARQFVASREAFSTAWIKGNKIWQAVYSVLFAAFVGYAALSMFGAAKGKAVHAPRYTGLIVVAVLLGASVLIGAYLFWRSRQKFVLTVNGDALTVGSRGEVYSLAEAQLGLWPNIGVALHLHSGGRRFVLGGQDRSISPATRLDAPAIPVVDARLPAAEFDEILRLGGRAAACGPTPGEPVRCVLFPNAQAIARMGAFAFRKKQQVGHSLNRAELYVDVDGDTIRIVEPENRSVDASAAVSRITATPSTYESHDTESNIVTRTAILTLTVPGMPAFSFGCRHVETSRRRFSWPPTTQIAKDPPTYLLSAADWRTPVHAFGLAASHGDAARKG